MIRGVGIDLVDVERLCQSIQASDRFIHKVYTPEEAEACAAASDPRQAYAACFGAKEAFSKAVGWGFQKGLDWRDVRLDLRTGELICSDRARRLMANRGGSTLQVWRSTAADLCLVLVLLAD